MKVSLIRKSIHFEWDKNKENINIDKHGIDFTLASEAFDDENGLFFYDKENSEGEERFKLLAQIANRIVILLVFTDREAIRIISARTATKKEKKVYVEYQR